MYVHNVGSRVIKAMKWSDQSHIRQWKLFVICSHVYNLFSECVIKHFERWLYYPKFIRKAHLKRTWRIALKYIFHKHYLILSSNKVWTWSKHGKTSPQIYCRLWILIGNSISNENLCLALLPLHFIRPLVCVCVCRWIHDFILTNMKFSLEALINETQ